MAQPQEREPHRDDWRPNARQERFLALKCFEALYGGQAGGGKSDSLLVDAVRYVGRGYGANYKALLLRREMPDLRLSLIPRSFELYPRLGGKFNQNDSAWRFPAGESVHFGHVQHEHDVHRYQGAEFQFVGFDELTTFLESQYRYLISRLRSAVGIPLRLRAGTNPGGIGHEWVFKRFAPWLDPRSEVKAAPSQVLYFRRDGEQEVLAKKGEPGALGRCFVPAALSDNQYLANDGVYSRGLEELDPVTRARLKDGNWLIKPAKGNYFKAAWFKWLDVAPSEVAARVRYWDLAGTTKASTKGDYAAGVKLSKTRAGLFVVEHVRHLRGTPGDVRAAVKAQAELDGRAVPIWIEQDPGQAGVDQIASYVTMLNGWTVRGRRKIVDKITAAGPLSSQAQAGNVALVRAPWNDAYVAELEAFPEGDHDDQVDGSSGAHATLSEPQYFIGTVDEVSWMDR